MISDFLPTTDIEFTMADADGISQPLIVEIAAVSQLTAVFRVRERIPGVSDDRCVSIQRGGYVLIEAIMSHEITPEFNGREIVLAYLSSGSENVPFLRKKLLAMFERGRLLLEIAINASAGVFVDHNRTEVEKVYRDMLIGRMVSSRRTKFVRTSPYRESAPAIPAVALSQPIEVQ
jgi:hypothetical protein